MLAVEVGCHTAAGRFPTGPLPLLIQLPWCQLLHLHLLLLPLVTQLPLLVPCWTVAVASWRLLLLLLSFLLLLLWLLAPQELL